jgi:hypothetical protein
MTFLNMLNRLESDKRIKVSMLDIRDFVDYCNHYGVFPCGGAIESDGSQWLYL